MVVVMVVVLVLGVVVVAVVVAMVVVLGVVLVAVVVAMVVPSLKLYNPLNPLARINYQRLGIGGVNVLQPRLEPYAVGHDHIGGLHSLNVAKRRLPVVRLYSAGNEHGHVGAVAAYSPGRLVHGIERCQHDEALVVGGGLGRSWGLGRGSDSLVDAGGYVLLQRLPAHAGGARQRHRCRNGRRGGRYRHRCHHYRATRHGRPAAGVLINVPIAINF